MEKNESMKKAKEKLNTMSEDETIRRLAELRKKISRTKRKSNFR